jgi:hypothetical protein
MFMVVLRYVLIAASIITLGLIWHEAYVHHPHPIWPAIVFPLFLILNIAYLVLSKSNKINSRISRLFHLWLDAKETELRNRAKRDL